MNRSNSWACGLVLALLMIAGGCGDDSTSPDRLECGDWCLGPDGGTVAVDNPDHPLYGVAVTVQPGAWEQNWAVYLGYQSTFTTPNFPDGLEGYAGFMTGSLELQISENTLTGGSAAVPDSLDLEITFPLRDLACETGEVFIAYWYDESVERWRLQLPVAATDSTITVQTHRHATLWTWGIVTLHEADWELYLEPALAEAHGTAAWAELKAELEAVYASIIDQDLAVNCNNLELVRQLFAAVRDDCAVRMIAHQNSLGGMCGVCDATTGVFVAEYLEYISLNIQAWVLELVFIDNGPNLMIMAYGFMRYCEVMAEIEDLACDYPCFWQQAPDEFYYDMAAYYISCGVIAGLDYAVSSGYIDCADWPEASMGMVARVAP